jgi:small conductance mechanosensitive channel
MQGFTTKGRLLYTGLLLWFLGCTTAQANTKTELTVAPANSQVSAQQVEDLIVTLESETARARLIEELKLLTNANDSRHVSFSFSDKLHIDETSSDLFRDYIQLIQRTDLDSSFINKSLLLLLVLLGSYTFAFLNARLSRYFNRKLQGLRANLDLTPSRFSALFRLQRMGGYCVAVLLFSYTAYSVLFSPPDSIRFGMWGLTVAEYTAIFFVLVFLVILSWELLNGVLEYGMGSRSSLNSSRVETLLPVIRNTAFFAIVVLIFLVTMSELGVNILPLLAGAGVVGIAVGFGAQTMVKDFISGITIVLEDLIQVGDIVAVGNRQGKVERITLRKIQLRSLDGVVHTVPHSEVNVVDNYTKDFAYYLMDIGVAYKEDTDKVVECVEGVDREMRENKKFSSLIQQPIEILGVDQFADSAVIIKARTKTNPHDKWTVGREFNRRIKQAFDKQGIEIPFPHRTVFLREELQGDAATQPRES